MADDDTEAPSARPAPDRRRPSGTRSTPRGPELKTNGASTRKLFGIGAPIVLVVAGLALFLADARLAAIIFFALAAILVLAVIGAALARRGSSRSGRSTSGLGSTSRSAGGRPTGTSRRPASGRPTGSGRTGTSGRPTGTSKGRPATGSSRSTGAAAKPSTAGKGRPAAAGRPTAAGKPSASGRPSGSGRPTGSAARRASAGRSSTSGNRAAGGRPGSGTNGSSRSRLPWSRNRNRDSTGQNTPTRPPRRTVAEVLSGKPKPRNPENWRNSDDARRTNRLRRNVDTPKGDEEKPRRRTRRRSRNRWQDNESATHDSRTGRRAVTKPRSDSDAEQPKRRRWRRRPAEAPDPEAKGSGPKPAKPGSGTDKPAGDGSSRRRRRRRNRRQAEPAVAEPVYDDMGFPLVNLADVRNAKAKEAKNATGTDVPVKPNVNPPTANPKTITVEGTGSTGSGDSAATPPKPAAQPKPPKAPAAASVTSTNGGNPMSPTATAPPEVVANPFLFEIDPNSSNSIASQMRTGAAEARQQGTEFATAAGDMRRKAAAAEGKGLHNAAAGFRRAASKNTVLADNRFGIADRLEAEADAQTKASA